MAVYYNEFDPYAAQWLRNLIAAGHIAAGDVDERSIEDVEPADLAGYSQCHFFAGIGVWSYALRLAGWPDDKPIWTGSAPCQPFSSAGKQKGFGDERHLWPEFFRLIAARHPELVVGEQVPAAVRLGWLDALFGDLEGAGYAGGAVILGAHSAGSPHIRQRLYWMAHANGKHGEQGDADERGRHPGSAARQGSGPVGGGVYDGVGDAIDEGLEGHDGHSDDSAGRPEPVGPVASPCGAGGLADTRGPRPPEQRRQRNESPRPAAHGVSSGLADTAKQRLDGRRPSEAGDGRYASWQQPERFCDADRPSPTDGFWRDADWLFCRDGKWRPVEPGTSALVDGSSARMGRMCADWRAPAGEAFGNRKGRLKGYGNAIVAPLAAEFVRAVMDFQPPIPGTKGE